MHMFILQGVMLYFDGIWYALQDAMVCNAWLLMSDADAWSGFWLDGMTGNVWR